MQKTQKTQIIKDTTPYEEQIMEHQQINYERNQKESKEEQVLESLVETKDIKHVLTDIDFGILQANKNKHDSFIKDNEIDELKTQLIDAQVEIIKRNKIIHSIQREKNNEIYDGFKKNTQILLNNISSKYGIPIDTNWSYDTKSHEIIINE